MSTSLRPVGQQVIVITGASSGIGLTTARMAAERGARLVLAARNEDALRTLTEEIRAAGGQAVYVVADVGREADVDAVAEAAIKEFGGFDTWVNNAGVSIVGEVMDVPVEDMRRLYDTVLWGVVHGSRAAVRHFLERGAPTGALITVGSVFGDRSTPLQAVYGSAKFAVRGFTEGLRVELAAHHAPVSVTLVHPGRIDTPYNAHAQKYVARQPVHRGMIYPPEAVAEAILFAAAHPRRDIHVGAQAKALSVLAGVAPGLTDLVMRRYMYWSQLADRPAGPPQESALHRPGFGLRARGTHQGWFRSRSYWVTATTHPLLTGAAAATAGAGLAWAITRRPGRTSR